MNKREYKLIWNGEVIDTFEDLTEAKEMKYEYIRAFNDSNITIKRGVSNEND